MEISLSLLIISLGFVLINGLFLPPISCVELILQKMIYIFFWVFGNADFVFYSLVGNYQIERYQLLTYEQVAIMFDCKMFLYVHPLPKKPFFVLSCKSQIL